MSRPIFLVGMPGAGKSTIGRKLSIALDRPFFDLDDFLEAKEGTPVRDIFSARGEAYFRQAESDALREVTQPATGSIIATGGGAPCFHGNMDFMNEHGTTIYLKVPVSVLVERLSGHGRDLRPLVAGKTPAGIKQFVTETLSSRMQFYEAAQIIYQPLSRGGDIADLCRLISRLEHIC